MKRFKFMFSVAMLAVVALVISFCQEGGNYGKVLKTIRNNAVSAIEFFPSSDNRPGPYRKPPRIHYNFKYNVDGETLMILIDDWNFNGGRKNRLRVYYIPLSEIDPNSAEIEMEEMKVGSISYKGDRAEIEPCRLILWTKEEGQSIKVETYDRGRGPKSATDPGRWAIPSGGAEVNYTDYGEIHVPNKQRAQNIIDALHECQ